VNRNAKRWLIVLGLGVVLAIVALLIEHL